MILKKKIAQNFRSSVQTTRMGLEPTTSAVTGRRSNQLSHRAIKGIIPSKPNTKFLNPLHLHYAEESASGYFLLKFAVRRILWLSPRPISKCQLNALLHLHLIPIYLVVFKGSYYSEQVRIRDISS